MLINAELLEQSTRFERGRPLPTHRELYDLLGRLHEARCENRHREAADLEAVILALVPSSGVYEGYLEDIGLQIFLVRIVSIFRKGSGANIHTFHIALEMLDGTEVVGTTTMELMSFLTPVHRSRSCDRQHVGARFWPF